MREKNCSDFLQQTFNATCLPLYLVTTAELTLRGSWKVTVSDVLLVIIRQTLVGASGAPGEIKHEETSEVI
ncbi:hypothetical protein XELAEV_18043800mg [Xenopus laevis]|uniref:Uncharacterized protein n=1 Tax=Xenopus laevis TaxID=8355 RepID=A0A974BXH3_XENLA|nr:hypothetical protein XELAEV_18043800mg [Xenopus laevis]